MPLALSPSRPFSLSDCSWAICGAGRGFLGCCGVDAVPAQSGLAHFCERPTPICPSPCLALQIKPPPTAPPKAALTTTITTTDPASSTHYSDLSSRRSNCTSSIPTSVFINTRLRHPPAHLQLIARYKAAQLITEFVHRLSSSSVTTTQLSALAMEWSHDFCLSCDRQIVTTDHGAYCSQACRLADVEQSCISSSPSPTTGATWTTKENPSTFQLPASLNFQSYTLRTPSSCSTSPTTRSPISSTYPCAGSSFPFGERPGQLYSSPSRTSLSSIQSYAQPSDSYLSAQAQNELREYAGSFDRTRYAQRRTSA
ncbi:hypothetical protein EX30DRAFT_387153 [Ascodesmis nigricans]|uniref:Uncharacterized protein n=1 Tax=Ascodesmis nigricans TaxID=341454 RepID=A0A4S2ML77_9PEZI|nr:hypothetical protein EX30DRAFT_387153 [Ascodesmis nigricans]